MPVILENGSDQIRNWLDPGRSEWSKELQSLLKPYRGELECYPVSKEVGKVGNNSPTFIIPVASTENRNNIANFFTHASKTVKEDSATTEAANDETKLKAQETRIKRTPEKRRAAVKPCGAEDNAPKSVPASTSENLIGLKRKSDAEGGGDTSMTELATAEAHTSPTTSPEKTPAKKSRSATSNGTKGGPVETSDRSHRITSYFHQ